MTDLVLAWAQADTFLGTGGTSIYIKNPTESDVAQYLAQFNASADEFQRLSVYALNESIKDLYPNPQLRIAFNSDGKVCGVVFYYEVLDQGDPFNWVECWADDGTIGAGSLLMYLTGDQTAQIGHKLCGRPEPSSTWAESRPYIGKDPTTKWYTITAEQLINLAKANKEAALATQNFSKIMQDTLTWLEPVTSTDLP
jgi:hypothetical protein